MPFKRFRALALTAFPLLVGSLAPAHAAAILLNFSGGSGSPLTITLAQPVTYTIDVAPTGGILFDFESVANLFGGTVNLSGTMTYTINGGTPISIDRFSNGTTGGTIAATDFVLFKQPASAAALGNVVVLSPGTLTTAINIAAAAPASGSYSAILVDQTGTQVAVGVPEPAAISLLVFGGLCCLARRRRTA